MKLILRNIVSALLALGLLAACSESQDLGTINDDLQTTSGIMNGAKVDVKKEALASATALLNIVLPQEESDSICTGTVIGNRVILTAAHCVEDLKGLKLKKLSVEKPGHISAVDMLGEKALLMAVTTSKGIIQQLDVEEVAVHFNYSSEGLAKDKKGDIALIKLRKPVSGLLIKVKIDTFGLAKAGRKVLSLGYGANQVKIENGEKEFTTDQTLQRKEFVIKDLSGIELPENLKDSYLVENRNAAKTGGVCNGDSGGPSLVRTDRGYYVVGVLSRTTEECDGLSIMTSVKYYEPWIKKQVKIWGLTLH